MMISTSTITPVILCGGSGTRLWPLSRKSFPKQFVPLIGGKSLLQLTLERVTDLSATPIVVAAEDHRFMVTEALQQTQLTGPIILEPVARGTTAAMALAALHTDSHQLLLFCPADHHIPNAELFIQTVQQGVAAAEAGAIVTYGITPTFPSTAYGYIQHGATRSDGSYQVKRFIEKPNTENAQQLLLQGDVLWNAGIFLMRAGVLLNALKQHAPDILQACQQAMQHKQEETLPNGYTFIRPAEAALTTCRSQSIDYAVMEKHADVAVIPFQGSWSDVGSWNAVADLEAADTAGNRIEGYGFALHAKTTYIHAPQRLVTALGTEDLLIIDTPDALLVANRHYAEQTKDIVAELDARQHSEAISHRKVARPWGWYDLLDSGEHFQVRHICIKPGNSLSLQKHQHRAEHWIVIKGTAEVTRGTETFLLSENQSTPIPAGETHRLRNPSESDLEIIEVQSGSDLSEEDIVRFR